MPNVADRCSSVTTSLERPGRDHPALAQQQRVGEARRDLLDVVGDQHGGRRVGVVGEHRQRGDQVLAAAEVEPGRGLVEQQQLGVGHQRAGDLHPLALALAEGAEGAVGEVLDAHLDEQLAGALVVEVVVLLAPAPDDAVRRRHDDVAHPLVARDPVGERGAGEADPRGAARRRRRCRAPRRGCRRRPAVGWICAEATCSSVVLPAPLGPRITQRSSSSTVQATPSSSVACRAGR